MITVLDPESFTAAFSELSPGKALRRATTPDRTSSRVGADRAGRDVEPGCDHVNPALCGHANQPSSQVHGTSGDPSEDLFPRGPLGKRSSEGSREVPQTPPRRRRPPPPPPKGEQESGLRAPPHVLPPRRAQQGRGA